MTRSEAKRLKLTTTLADAHALADRALATVRAKHARAAERSPRATGATKAAKRARVNAETARLRAYADKRDPACVICGEPAPEPWEFHHVDSGTGKTQRQSTTNTCKTHEGCHKRAHRGDTVALGMLAAWAYGHGYTDTLAIIERRILKVHEARSFTGRPVLRAPSTPATNTTEDDRHE